MTVSVELRNTVVHCIIMWLLWFTVHCIITVWLNALLESFDLYVKMCFPVSIHINCSN